VPILRQIAVDWSTSAATHHVSRCQAARMVGFSYLSWRGRGCASAFRPGPGKKRISTEIGPCAANWVWTQAER
jgi:hypothetical protein